MRAPKVSGEGRGEQDGTNLFCLHSTAKFESKHSSSIDSIDASPNLEHHRRSKSILKNKSDVSRVLSDPESERLLADNMSGSGVSDNGTVMVAYTYPGIFCDSPLTPCSLSTCRASLAAITHRINYLIQF